jgi:glutathione S-transferase
MLKLIHHPLSAPSRKIRLQLAEKDLEFQLELEKPWERREAFLLLNPAGEVPVLLAEDGTPIADATAISELLEEVHPEPQLLGSTPLERAEVRRLVGWFDGKFWREVGRNLVEEKIFRRLYGQGGPDSLALRAGRANIHAHLDYIGWLSLRRNWLAVSVSLWRYRRRRASLDRRLCRRCALERARGRQALVCARQIAAELPAVACRPAARRAAAAALRGSGFLENAHKKEHCRDSPGPWHVLQEHG